MDQDLAFRSATELAQLIRDREISSEELTRLYIDRIEQHDGDINAVIVRRFEQAVDEARAADNSEPSGLLHGVPMTIKESYVMDGTPATWGIPSYKDNVADHDGLAVSRFKAAGAHFLGKTNVPIDLADFQSYNDIYGTTNNPWNLERVPGGSSGGSSAAVAAGFSGLEAGSDIGGSIRTPAHFAGVYGHKPTYGIIPQTGHELMSGIPDADLSVCGPLGRSAADLELGLDVMAGPTGREATGWRLELPEAPFDDLKGVRVALWPTDDISPVSRETEARVRRVGEILEGLGAVVSDTARPEFDVKKANFVYQNLLNAVMSSAQPPAVIAEIQNVVDGLDPEDMSDAAVTARAAVMPHREWVRHDVRREKLRIAWDEFFDNWDILVCPQWAVPAIEHDHRPVGDRSISFDGETYPYGLSLFWSGLIIASYLPSTCFPTGLSEDGLPIGLQAVGAPYRDRQTIRFADLITREIGGYTPPPALV